MLGTAQKVGCDVDFSPRVRPAEEVLSFVMPFDMEDLFVCVLL